MKSIVAKNMLIAAGTLISAAAFATPGAHGPTGGLCSPDHDTSSNGVWDCVEWTGAGTMTGNDNHASEGGWFGPGGTSNANDTFVFRGDSALACPLASADCTLELRGQVRVNTETGNDLSIKVLDGSVSGSSFLCGSINISGFPWYAADTSEHDVFDNASYISSPGGGSEPNGVGIGNFGNIDLSALIYNISDGHVHDVEFSNGDPSVSDPSYFYFNSVIYEDGSAHSSQGCSVDGKLYIADGVDDINAY